MDETKSPFDKISNATLSESIIAQIKKSIMEGVYRPGDKLPHEKELLRRFSVSRNSLREALRALEQMGLISIRRGAQGGAYVQDRETGFLSAALLDSVRMAEIGLDELSELRLLIEPGMARLAARNRSEEDIESMAEQIALRQGALREGKIPIVVGIDFHQAVARASKNRMVRLLVDAMASIFLQEFRKIALSMDDHRSILGFHERIFGAIKDRDEERAFGYMKEHIADVTPRLAPSKTN